MRQHLEVEVTLCDSRLVWRALARALLDRGPKGGDGFFQPRGADLALLELGECVAEVKP